MHGYPSAAANAHGTNFTSLNKEIGRDVDMAEIKEKLKKNFSELFEAEII